MKSGFSYNLNRLQNLYLLSDVSAMDNMYNLLQIL